jgi:NADPH:quinone reductase-like Zn-dependent oxidoreductase
MSVQKALVVKQIGSPVVLVTDRPTPSPGPGQVLVKVSVASLNPHDAKARDTGLLIGKHLPAVLTNDVVGIVSQLGEGVTEYAIGDRIAYQADIVPGFPQSGLQEYATAEVVASIKIPDSISDDEAATLPINLLTSVISIHDALGIPPQWSSESKTFNHADQTILIVGGGSNCGKFGVQLAALAGIGRIVVVGGPKEELLSYGAAHVLDRHGGHDAVLKRIKDIVGDDLVYAYDTVNPPEEQHLALNALSSHKKGRMARIRPHGPVDRTKVYGKEAGYDVLDVMGSALAKPDVAIPFLKRLPRFLEEGKIKPLKFITKQGLNPDHVNEVLDAYRDQRPVTKVNIHI